MATKFKTGSSGPGGAPADDAGLAARVAAPLPVAQVLGEAGTKAARAQAKADRATRDVAALAGPAPLDEGQHAHIVAKGLRTGTIDPVRAPPDPRLVRRFGTQACLKHRVLPWRDSAGRVTVLAASAEDFLRVRDALTVIFGTVHLAITTNSALDRALARVCRRTLMQNAELRTPEVESCRGWNTRSAMFWGVAVLTLIALAAHLWLVPTVLLLCGWAIFTLFLNTLLKCAAAILHLSPRRARASLPLSDPPALPVVTVLVPLFRERDIAGALVDRLSRLDYPAERLDVCLVLEADDYTTQAALSGAQLPHWMRAIHVPLGTLQTKPRALNYALSFAKGSIIGVYDAEDAPAPDQLHVVADRFARCAPDVACLQGQLDFYNSHSNWLARCFTIEYAAWFRIILPGLERLGLVIPLGGTTLFFRRDVLEDLGGWDAHNVTEDADLGIRLARHGYRTEIIETVTQEEANARAWPWVKQRSRWLKGYAITYGVHMRAPRRLWRELGPWRFFGVQLLFAGTISQFLLAPLLWSFWLMLLGLPHPLTGVLSFPVAMTFAGLFLASEVIGISVSALAVVIGGKRDMVKWTPTLHFYFPLAALAAYKGVFELATRPFYWDKTSHGIFAPTTPLSSDAPGGRDNPGDGTAPAANVTPITGVNLPRPPPRLDAAE
ncbi:glycosyltransferase family 2 protein [Thalassorhabdomicrobium marinisediminis]|uniref:Glycosyl transferase n=1 Tax=Thalassorhabdomicrobium marinisediminis TaxID=2170577 RepID=A0A2T7FWJ4_9RHOB|nr:glycosyltransferase family 2 protein [Thalassorhabdomicrobium marinisediminis]PVA06532.1 glycosyl transferase [Thalassorhabdomicrobium marinisediminis]